MLQSSKLSRFTQQIDQLREELGGALAKLRQEVEDEKAKQSSSLHGLTSKSEDLQRRLNDAESGNRIEQADFEKFKHTAQVASEKVFEHAEQLSAHQAAIQKLQRDLEDDRLQQNSTVKEMTTKFGEQEAATARLKLELLDQRSQQNATLQACRETVLATAKGCEQMAQKTLAAETTIAELAEQMAAIAKFQQELFDQRLQQDATVQACREKVSATARECDQLNLKTSATETTIAELWHGLQERTAAIYAIQKEFSRELYSQRTQLLEQDFKFGMAADSDKLKQKLSVLESSFDEMCASIGQKPESAIA